MANLKSSTPEKAISHLLKAIMPTARLQILLGIGGGEACVCHLEALLDLRQAYISQHLMALRKAGILETRRDGRFIFYRLGDARLLELIQEMGVIAGIPQAELDELVRQNPLPQCCCPTCTAALNSSILTEEEIPS